MLEKNNPMKYISIGRLSREGRTPIILKILSKTQILFHYTIIGNDLENSTIFALIKKFSKEKNHRLS